MISRLTHETWGRWPAQRLASSRVAMLLVPALGARVVSLMDIRSGREWLVQGEPLSEQQAQEWSAEDAVFGGQVSFGWDECLPTVAPCPDPLEPRAAPLRDHGDQWGRATETVWHDGAPGARDHLAALALAVHVLSQAVVRGRRHGPCGILAGQRLGAADAAALVDAPSPPAGARGAGSMSRMWMTPA